MGAAQHPNSSASAKFPALRRCSQTKKQALHNFRVMTRIVSDPGPFRVSGASGRGSHMSGIAHQNPPTPSPGGPGGGLKHPRCPLATFGQSKVTENAHLPRCTSKVEQEKHNPSGSFGPTSLCTREAPARRSTQNRPLQRSSRPYGDAARQKSRLFMTSGRGRAS